MKTSHNMSILDYKNKYGSEVQIFSKNTSEYFSELTKEFNLNKENTYVSKAQNEVKEFIENKLGFKCGGKSCLAIKGIGKTTIISHINNIIPRTDLAIEYYNDILPSDK
jgi:hypothetical protein